MPTMTAWPRYAALTLLRYLAAGLAGVIVGIVLVLAFQSLTAPGAPVPSAPTVAGASATPEASLTPVGLPNHDRTPGAINAAATRHPGRAGLQVGLGGIRCIQRFAFCKLRFVPSRST